ncbi:MAG: hypothetical protein LBC42_01355, partial [Puniceicoccales bacterium]|nr:hypothetical protein [Puniceicoccales bacterium]
GILAGRVTEEGNLTSIDGDMVAKRAVFLIDLEGIVQHMTVNAMSLGRNVDELLRVVDALQFVEKNGEVCPANWHAGQKTLAPTANGLAAFFSPGK